MPETSTECIVLSRRIEICGFVCKLVQITQRYVDMFGERMAEANFVLCRIYSNLLRLTTKQLEPLLIPVVFYHDRSSPSPFIASSANTSSVSNYGVLASPRGPSTSPAREYVRPGHISSTPNMPSATGRASTQPPAAQGASLPRSSSSSFLSTSSIITGHLDHNCSKTSNDILLVLSRVFYNLTSNNVYYTIVQQFFTQVRQFSPRMQLNYSTLVPIRFIT